MTAAAVTSGTASYYNSLIFLESAGSGSETVHSAPKNIEFYTNNSAGAAGSGASYQELGNLALELQADGDAIFYDNVGIGTTSPATDLHVNSENAEGSLTLSRGGNNMVSGQGVGSIVFPADYNGTPTNYGKIVTYANALSGLRGSIDFKVKSTSGNLLTGLTVYGTMSGANVGIGTTSPGHKLEVNGNVKADYALLGRGFRAANRGELHLNGTGTTDVAEMFFGYGDGFTEANIRWGISDRGTADGRLIFYRGPANGGFLETLVLKDNLDVIVPNGNVGIGTDSPETITSTVSTLTLNGTSGTVSGGFAYQVNGTTKAYSYVENNYLRHQAQSGVGQYWFADGSIKMAMLSGGNVGIGTTSPGSKLQVAGEIRAADGNKGTPSYTFTSDTNTGMYSDTADVIDFTAGGTKSLSVTTSGATVYGSALMPSNAAILLQNQNNNNQFYIRNSGVSDATFQVGQGAPGSNVRFFINSSGNVGIGNTASTASVKLEITGNTLLKNSNGVGDLYLGNYATANHFRFHTNNANTYFDMNCGDIYWRQGASTRYTFFPTTANMTVNGTITQLSDIRNKENIVEISDCISKVQAMRGVYYNRTDFNTDVTKVGVIAQEVEDVLPELIIESPEDGLKSVAYSELTAVLINAIKEQQEIIEDLKTRITKLEN